MRRTFQYRVQLSKTNEANCLRWLEQCRILYNLALEQRITIYRQSRKSLSCYDQIKQLPELKKEFSDFKQVDSQCLQDVLERLDKAFKGFFRHVKQGKAGFPRFKSFGRYDSFTLKQCSWKLNIRNLTIKNIGVLSLRLSRPIEGRIKTITIRRTPTGKWFACFSCDEVPVRSFPITTAEVGIDVGSRTFCTDSDGFSIPNPKYLKQGQADLRRKQRRLARRVRGSQRRKKARMLVAKAHEKVANQRKDFLHKLANDYIRKYKTIHIEDLNIQEMVKGIKGNTKYIGKSVADAGWGEFFRMLSYKAEEAGRVIVRVPSKDTTTTCSRCGVAVPKSLTIRIHRCPSCNLKIGRDLNAALNLLRVGQTLQASTWADVRPCVA